MEWLQSGWRSDAREAHKAGFIRGVITTLLLLYLAAQVLLLCSCTTRVKFGNEGSSGYVFEAGSGPAPCESPA